METGSLLEEALRQQRNYYVPRTHDDEQQQQHYGGAVVAPAAAALWLDIHLIPNSSLLLDDDNDDDDIQQVQKSLLLELANVARQVNDFFHSKSFDWYIGGDGPVFGIHYNTTDGIPHLRGICYYGVSVVDEWAAIQFILQFTSACSTCTFKTTKTTTTTTNQNYYELVVECWDVQDGQIILIESSGSNNIGGGGGGLPVWVDRIGPEACRHRCWIRNGQIQLIAPIQILETTTTTSTARNNNNNSNNHLTLQQALETLRLGETETNILEFPRPNIQEAIRDCFSRFHLLIDESSPSSTTTTAAKQQQQQQQGCRHSSSSTGGTSNSDLLHHKAVVAVPRTVAFLIEKRPDLVNAAIVAFADHALYYDPPMATKTTTNTTTTSTTTTTNNNNVVVCEDWVLTTHQFTRTNYAMLRTLCSPTWRDGTHIPKQYQSIELKRLRRQCALEVMPHLRHAVHIGVRLIAGLNSLLQQQKQQPTKTTTTTTTTMLPPSLKERRALLYWPKLIQEGLGQSSTWIVEAWNAGPHHAVYNLEDILECPVVQDELLPCSSSSSSSNNNNTTNIITLLSHPEISVQQQIQQLLKKAATSAEEGYHHQEYSVPKLSDVDDPNEDWMLLTDETLEKTLSSSGRNTPKQQQQQQQQQQQEKEKEHTVQLDNMLKGFQSFMVDQSGVEGVAHTTSSTTTKDQQLNKKNNNSKVTGEEEKEVHINPRIFLNLLHKVLDPSTTVEDIVFPVAAEDEEENDDPFFSKEDYDDAMSEEDEDDPLPDNLPIDTDVVELMAAMDKELKGTAAGGRGDDSDDAGFSSAAADGDGEAVEEAKILSNLLQSLEAGVGGRGPVQSMMKAMDLEPPRLPSDDDD